MKVLGISAFFHDSAAALIDDGVVVAAAEEERFSRKKHDSSFPSRAIRHCLERSACRLAEIDRIVFYDKPIRKFRRSAATWLAFAPRGFEQFAHSFPQVAARRASRRSIVRALSEIEPTGEYDPKLFFCDHHLSHAASAFFASPFEEAAVLTVDGVGEWTTTSAASGRGNTLNIYKEIHFPHSLGLLYSAFTAHAGFKVNSGEYKLMGLAPYGSPIYAQAILEHLIDLRADGSFRLNMEYFNYCTGLTMTTPAFDRLFGGPARTPEAPITKREQNLAASIQAILEHALCTMAEAIARETGQRKLCMAGGVALNCVANSKLLGSGAFENIWVQPAAGDSGGALGAALALYHLHEGKPRFVRGASDAMKGAYLGPAFTQGEIEKALGRAGAKFKVVTREELLVICADAIANGNALGWFQGRMEFGPRALGARSILADARDPHMQTILNQKVKQREAFRPFAPVIRREDLTEWFDFDRPSPYMLFVAPVAERHRDIPAVTHVDFSARVQTVEREVNPRFYDLLAAFKARTGCAVMVNTSFNVRGEPIVCTPEDAFRCFMGTDLDALAIGDCWLQKAAQDPELARSYAQELELD